ncbi:hypothetical protein ACFSKN_04615 [Mariniflexile gromovii]|uniref:VanZ like protein n=1 Tax=Mariniflexile gromovii TaxID=362523 RepID=A0ABS4BXT7_9FLAO|nr:hypothetical protein [Mariniflexile gromovii]MBP0904870.1 hypothetical protein [Mariniflexile gromovii]
MRDFFNNPYFLLIVAWLLGLLGDKYVLPLLPEVKTIGNWFISFKKIMVNFIVWFFHILNLYLLPFSFIIIGITRLFGYDIIYQLGINSVDKGEYTILNILGNVIGIIIGFLTFIYFYTKYKQLKENVEV